MAVKKRLPIGAEKKAREIKNTLATLNRRLTIAGVKVSQFERNSKSMSERVHWAAARTMSVELVERAQQLTAYLHGKAGDPSVMESCFKLADQIRYELVGALAIHKDRSERRAGEHE